jgi:hypothetical protein
VIVAIFIALELWHSHKAMYNTTMAFAEGAVAIASLRSDLVPPMLTGTLSFAVLLLYAEFVHRFYNMPNSLGSHALGVPIEELFFAAADGAIWSVACEGVQG